MSVAVNDKEFEHLAQLVPLNTLSEAALESLLSRVKLESVKKGTILFREGDVDHVNFYLLSGKVGLYSGSSQVDTLEDASPTARFPVAHQVPRKFSAKALTKLEFVRIDSRVLSEALADKENDEYQVDEIEQEEDNDWMSQLLKSNVMQNIPASNLQGVMMRMQEIHANADEVIINEGDEGDYYYLLNKGQVVVLKRDENGVDQEVVKLGPGTSFGEDALLSDSPRSSTVKMLTEGVLMRLSKDDFIELIRHPLSESLSYDDAKSLIDRGAVWVDVRESDLYEAGHLEGAINMPYKSLRFQIPSLATDHDYVIYSQSGKKSIASAFLFLERGLQASVLDSGYSELVDDLEQAVEEPADEASVALKEEISQLKEQFHEVEKELEGSGLVEPDTDVDSDTEEQPEPEAGPEPEPESETEAGPGVVHSEELDQLIKDKDELQQKFDRMQRENIALSEQLESEEEVYDKLKQQFDSLSDENKKHLQVRDQEIAKLKEKLTVLQLERDQFETDLEEMTASMETAAAEPEKPVNSEQSQLKIDELEALNAAIVSERESQGNELEELRNQLSLSAQENSELQLEIADLKDQLVEALDAKRKMQSKLKQHEDNS